MKKTAQAPNLADAPPVPGILSSLHRVPPPLSDDFPGGSVNSGTDVRVIPSLGLHGRLRVVFSPGFPVGETHA